MAKYLFLVLLTSSALAKEMLPEVVFSAEDLSDQCELLSAVTGATKGKRAAFGANLSRVIALRQMLAAAHEAGATS